MSKIIHYCWFGGAPLPKLAKKCIKSWEKYLPDYKIMKWTEENVDLEECPFIKGAYENKKWAFVADYVRAKALTEHGGIYFDTDMEVTKDISKLLEDKTFLGVEDSGYVAVGVWYEKEKNAYLPTQLLKKYQSLGSFDADNLGELSIPKMISAILDEDGFKKGVQEIQKLKNDVVIYPRDYFYPYSYKWDDNLFTENTCMKHYYDASWKPLGERLYVGLIRKFGQKKADKIIRVYYFICGQKNRFIGFIKGIAHRIFMFLSIHLNQNKRVAKVKEELTKQKEPYLAICHPEWMGIKNSTKDTFKEELIELREQYTEKEARKMAQAIVDAGKKMVVFSGFAQGWDNVAKSIKEINPEVKVKIILHGSHALLSEYYDWIVFSNIMNLYQQKVIDEIATVKKSLYDFYKAKGIQTSFIMNTVSIEDKEKYMPAKKQSNTTKIGLYVSGDRWVKNIYNQISAVSLMENVTLDCLPLNPKITELAQMLNIKITGTEQNVSRDEMFKRIASNDINLYVTFTECSPLIPLESLELGVPCITGDNHHYFEGTELEKYLVVSKEDNIMAIHEKIKYVMENKEKILELYTEWKKQYDITVKENRESFLKY